MRSAPRIPPSVAKKLGYYVYVYVDPLDDTPFYVGKGKGGRALAHLKAGERKALTKRIRKIEAAGDVPRIEILVHGLPDEETALRVEAAVIDLIGVSNLTNQVRGWGSVKYGRTPLPELVAHYTRRKATIGERAILIRINKNYRYGMSDRELYDATRSAWKVGRRRGEAEYAFAVYAGVVREVYRITGWLPAGSTFNSRADGRGIRSPGRWEFVGVVAPDKLRRRYLNRYVGHLFTQGAQNPISYVNI